MDQNTEHNLDVLKSYNVHQYPVISFAGIFSQSKSYTKGDVVFYTDRLYQAVLDSPPAIDPLNSNWLPFNTNANTPGIFITSNTNVQLVSGHYYVAMQGGGAGGSQSGPTTGGGGGSAGFITYFDLYVPAEIVSQNFVIVVGLGGGIANQGNPTSLNLISSYSTILAITGGNPGSGSMGGQGWYGGGGGAPNASGGGSFTGDGFGITPGNSATQIDVFGNGIGGLGSFSGTTVQPISDISVGGGAGGGLGAGYGGYFSANIAQDAAPGVPNSGSGGGGGGRNAPNGLLTASPGIGGSGWVLIKPITTS